MCVSKNNKRAPIPHSFSIAGCLCSTLFVELEQPTYIVECGKGTSLRPYNNKSFEGRIHLLRKHNYRELGGFPLLYIKETVAGAGADPAGVRARKVRMSNNLAATVS